MLWMILLTGISTGAQSLSADCQTVDNFSAPNIPQYYHVGTFNANERITLTALVAITGFPDGLYLEIDGVRVETVASIPASVSYTFPADGVYEIRARLFMFVYPPGAAIAANFEGACEYVPPSDTTAPSPAFNDGRINDFDTYNPVVLYGNQNGDTWGLDVYDAEDSSLLFSVSPEMIASIDDCPEENILIYEDTVHQILFYRLSSCQYYLRAPMNEAGKWYIIIFDDLFPHSYYESWTEYMG